MGYDLHDLFQHAAKYFYKRFKSQGGSQKELADKLGITQSYLSSVINGSRTASLEMHCKIANILYGPYDKFLKAGRRLMDGFDPLEEEKPDPYDSVENLIAHLTHYVMEQQLIHKQLRISEEKFRDISLTSGDMIFELDKDFTFKFASGKVKEVVGLEENDIIGKKPADLLDDAEWTRIKQLIDQAIANRTILNDVLTVNRDGNTYYRHLIAKPVFADSTDEFVGIRGTYRDITKRKNLEKDLTEQMCLFQSAIDIFEEDGLLFIDRNNKALRWNDHYKNLIGYPDEVLETRDLNLYLKYLKPMIADLEEYEQGLQEVMEATNKTLHYCHFRDGRTIKRQVYPIFKDDQLYGRILRLQDVTGEKKKKAQKTPRKKTKKK
jgi:PAS domain S-box-containing protein